MPRLGIAVSGSQTGFCVWYFPGFAVDAIHFYQCEIAFAFLGCANFTLNGVAGMQVEAPNLRRGYVNIIRTGQIGSIRRAQKTETILQNFQGAIA